MIVDSSALIAIVFREEGYESLISKLEAAGRSGAGTPTLAQTAVVLAARLGDEPTTLLTRLLDELNITPVSFGDQHWQETASAYLRFGRGRHPAALNFGDCLAYAVAKLAGEPLLFVGADFGRTDIQEA